MCRISGVLLSNITNSTFDDQQEAVKRMSKVMQHGGPDGSGIHFCNQTQTFIAHRRLSIIDTSEKAAQPMFSDDGLIAITFNGEIYNFQNLRQSLISEGYQFRSNSDTEVIIKAYQHWGIDSFRYLKGMFAFALCDALHKKIYLIRDHAGIKPLYYGYSKGNLIFASEVRAFKTYNSQWQENDSWRTYLLLFGHIPEPYTTLEGVKMLPAGTFMEIDSNSGKNKIHTYIPFNFTEIICNERDAIELLREKMTTAVKQQLISDAPIGVFLSGGIDSTLISLLANQYDKKINTLSVNFNEAAFSEKKYQDIVQHKIQSNHHEYLVTEQDFIQGLPDIFRAMDQPSNDGVNTYFVSMLAHKAGLKSVLSGLGSDEIFGGYPSFNRMNKAVLLHKFAKKTGGLFRHFGLYPDDKLKKLSFLNIPDKVGIYLLLRGYFPINDVAKILEISEKEVYANLQLLYIDSEIQTDITSFNLASWLESRIYMRNQLLKDSDSMAMWHGLEIRVPFLDEDVVHLVRQICTSIKNKSTSQPKYLLTKAFENILPSEIVYRPKQGFTFPFQQWMLNNKNILVDQMKRHQTKQTSRFIKDFEQNKLSWSRFWSMVLVSR